MSFKYPTRAPGPVVAGASTAASSDALAVGPAAAWPDPVRGFPTATVAASAFAAHWAADAAPMDFLFACTTPGSPARSSNATSPRLALITATTREPASRGVLSLAVPPRRMRPQPCSGGGLASKWRYQAPRMR